MKARTHLVLLGAVLGSIALSGCARQRMGRPMRRAPQVTVMTLKAQTVTLTRELPGRTAAFQVAQVRPQVTGIVKRRLFVQGSFVHAGQPLYDLDDALYRAQLDSAKAALLKAQATLALDKLTAARTDALYKIDAVSLQSKQNADAAAAEAAADVAAARASVESSAVNLAYAHIASPISGYIGVSQVTPGALVTAQQSGVLATVQQLDPIYVDVSQSSTEWLALKQEIEQGRIQSAGRGTPVKIVLENGTTYPYQGRLQLTEVSVDPTTGGILLRAVVPNPHEVLLPGMYVRAIIDEGKLAHGLLVPQEAIQHDPKGNAVALVLGPGNRVLSRDVAVSRAIGNDWLVDSGLHAGDRVIVSGLQKVRPGMMVQPEEAAVTSESAAAAAGRTAPGGPQAQRPGTGAAGAVAGASPAVTARGTPDPKK